MIIMYNWQKHNLNYLKDIFDNYGKIICKQAIEAKYKFQIKYLEYKSLLVFHNSYSSLWIYTRLGLVDKW
jgi:hypothetical protein